MISFWEVGSTKCELLCRRDKFVWVKNEIEMHQRGKSRNCLDFVRTKQGPAFLVWKIWARAISPIWVCSFQERAKAGVEGL